MNELTLAKFDSYKEDNRREDGQASVFVRRMVRKCI